MTQRFALVPIVPFTTPLGDKVHRYATMNECPGKITRDQILHIARIIDSIAFMEPCEYPNPNLRIHDQNEAISKAYLVARALGCDAESIE